MRIRFSTVCICAAILSVAIVIVALNLPVYDVVREADPSEDYGYDGAAAAAVGWMAVLNGASYAWLANPLWIWSMFRMFFGKAPNLVATLAALLLAATAYMPLDAQRLDDWAYSDGHPMYGITVWMGALAIPALVSIAGLALKHRRRTDVSAPNETPTP